MRRKSLIVIIVAGMVAAFRIIFQREIRQAPNPTATDSARS